MKYCLTQKENNQIYESRFYFMKMNFPPLKNISMASEMIEYVSITYGKVLLYL